MKYLAYQWVPGAYSHQAARTFVDQLWIAEEYCTWYGHFDEIWKRISWETYGVLPIENSYAWPIHTNMYRFLTYPYSILTDLYQPIHHCLLATHTDIKQIQKVYSHPQALEQCYAFCQKHHIEQVARWDTAGAAQRVKEQNDPSIAAIASSLAGELYDLEVIQEHIQDNEYNTTRFFLVWPQSTHLETQKDHNHITMLFSIRNGQWVLYKCLWAFATHGINLTKIESLPSRKDPFTYMFRLECEGSLQDDMVKATLDELAFFTTEIRILWTW